MTWSDVIDAPPAQRAAGGEAHRREGRGPRTRPPRPELPARRRTWWGWVLLGVVVVVDVVVTSWTTTGGVPVDYLTYRYAAAAAWRGVDVYHGQVRGPRLTGQPFTYTPFAALVFTPTALVGWRTGYVLCSTASLGALWASLAAVLRASARPARGPALGLVLVAMTTCVVVSNLVYGQINIILMGLVIADLLRRGDSRLARVLPRGALVGLAAAIKLTPALFIVYFVLTRQWRLAVASTTAAALATLAAAAAFPSMTRTFALHTVWHLADRVDLHHPPGYWANTSLTGALDALGPAATPFAHPVVLVAGASFLALAWVCHRQGRELDAWLVVGLAAPMLSPFTWQHHVVYLLPALARLGWRLQAAVGHDRRSRVRAQPAAAAVTVVVLLALGPGTGHALLATGSPWAVVPGAVLRESLLLASVASILALALWPPGDPLRSRRPADAAGWGPAEPRATRMDGLPAVRREPPGADRPADPLGTTALEQPLAPSPAPQIRSPRLRRDQHATSTGRTAP